MTTARASALGSFVLWNADGFRMDVSLVTSHVVSWHGMAL